MASKTDIAWAAGFFDGEGCTSIQTDRRKGYVYLIVSVGQKDRRVLERWADVFGGVRIYGPYNTEYSQVRLIDAQARRVMKIMWPYLSEAKKEQFERKAEEYACARAAHGVH